MILSNVNIGTGPSAGDGDTLRSAFSTINNNFQLVTNNVASLTNSVSSVAGRSGNIILTVNDVIGAASIAYVNGAIFSLGTANANATIKTYLSTGVEGNIVPTADMMYSLGNITHQWKDLWVSNSTIYMNGVPLSLNGDNQLEINGQAVTTGNVLFTGSDITTANDTAIQVVAKDAVGNVTARSYVTPYNAAGMEVQSTTNSQSFSAINNDWATGTWSNNGYGYGKLTFTNASSLLYFFQNTLSPADSDNVEFVVNGLYRFTWDGGTSSDENTGFIEFSTGNTLPPIESTTVDTLDFTYFYKSRLEVTYDNNEIQLIGNGMGVYISASNNFYSYIDNGIEMSAGAGINLSATTDLNLQGRTVYLTGNSDINVNCYDEMKVVSHGNIQPITFTTDSDGAGYNWLLNADGTTFPNGGTYRFSPPPLSSKGDGSSVVGAIAFDAGYIYYCIAPFTGDSSDIWRRVAFVSDVW